MHGHDATILSHQPNSTEESYVVPCCNRLTLSRKSNISHMRLPTSMAMWGWKGKQVGIADQVFLIPKHHRSNKMHACVRKCSLALDNFSLEVLWSKIRFWCASPSRKGKLVASAHKFKFWWNMILVVPERLVSRCYHNVVELMINIPNSKCCVRSSWETAAPWSIWADWPIAVRLGRDQSSAFRPNL